VVRIDISDPFYDLGCSKLHMESLRSYVACFGQPAVKISPTAQGQGWINRPEPFEFKPSVRGLDIGFIVSRGIYRLVFELWSRFNREIEASRIISIWIMIIVSDQNTNCMRANVSRICFPCPAVA